MKKGSRTVLTYGGILIAVLIVGFAWTEYILMRSSLYKMRWLARITMEDCMRECRQDPNQFVGPTLDLSVDDYVTFEWRPKSPVVDSFTLCVSFNPSAPFFPVWPEPQVWGRRVDWSLYQTPPDSQDVTHRIPPVR